MSAIEHQITAVALLDEPLRRVLYDFVAGPGGTTTDSTFCSGSLWPGLHKP